MSKDVSKMAVSELQELAETRAHMEMEMAMLKKIDDKLSVIIQFIVEEELMEEGCHEGSRILLKMKELI